MAPYEPVLPLTGGCVCGAVRFAVDRPLGPAGWCHCTRCRRRTGAHASPQARAQPGSFRLSQGQDVVREWEPPTGGFVKAFCSVCGSHLYSRNPAEAEHVAVRLGAFDADPGVRPSYHQRVETAAVWQPLPDDDLPRFEGPAPQTTAHDLQP
ncbi:MAG: GFA family protein [Solirubrobacteraceae bacterium]